MNQVKLSPISNRETYSESFEAIDENGDPIDLEAVSATIVCEMRLPGNTSTTALTVAIEDEVFTISLTEAQTRSLCAGMEYEIGCTIEIDDVVTQFFVGVLPIIDGIVS
jgi:hypothetical protein